MSDGVIIPVKYIDYEMPHLVRIGGEKKSAWFDVRASRVKINGEEVPWLNGHVENVDGDENVVDSKEALAVTYEAGDYLQVYLGFAMQLPEGYEAFIAPRGSTYKNYGLIQANSWGVVDEAFCGDDDEWFIPYVALRSGYIEKHDRIGQFRIIKSMGVVDFEPVPVLGNPNRGSHGSTGVL